MPCSNNRPTVLVLTYDDAQWEAAQPYWRHVMHPCRPVRLYGKNHRMDARVAGSHVVWYGMRDVVLPFIQSEDWHADTLFLVFEEDWRHNEKVGQDILDAAIAESRTPGAASGSAPSSVAAAATESRAPGAAAESRTPGAASAGGRSPSSTPTRQSDRSASERSERPWVVLPGDSAPGGAGGDAPPRQLTAEEEACGMAHGPPWTPDEWEAYKRLHKFNPVTGKYSRRRAPKEPAFEDVLTREHAVGRTADVPLLNEHLLEDIVRLCNLAAKRGHGDTMPLAWKPTRAVPTLPSWGSAAVAYSQAGAQWLWEQMVTDDGAMFSPNHFDLALFRTLQAGSWQDKVGACFVHPSVGSEQPGRSSDADPGYDRSNIWHNYPIAQDTRAPKVPFSLRSWNTQRREGEARYVWVAWDIDFACPSGSASVDFSWRSDTGAASRTPSWMWPQRMKRLAQCPDEPLARKTRFVPTWDWHRQASRRPNDRVGEFQPEVGVEQSKRQKRAKRTFVGSAHENDRLPRLATADGIDDVPRPRM